MVMIGWVVWGIVTGGRALTLPALFFLSPRSFSSVLRTRECHFFVSHQCPVLSILPCYHACSPTTRPDRGSRSLPPVVVPRAGFVVRVTSDDQPGSIDMIGWRGNRQASWAAASRPAIGRVSASVDRVPAVAPAVIATIKCYWPFSFPSRRRRWRSANIGARPHTQGRILSFWDGCISCARTGRRTPARPLVFPT